MLILTYFGLASKLQTLWSKDYGSVKHQAGKSCLKTGPKCFWSVLCQGFTLLAKHFTSLAASQINDWYWHCPTPQQLCRCLERWSHFDQHKITPEATSHCLHSTCIPMCTLLTKSCTMWYLLAPLWPVLLRRGLLHPQGSFVSSAQHRISSRSSR